MMVGITMISMIIIIIILMHENDLYMVIKAGRHNRYNDIEAKCVICSCCFMCVFVRCVKMTDRRFAIEFCTPDLFFVHARIR